MSAASRTIYFKNNAGCLWEEPQAYLHLEYYPGARNEAQFQALLNHARQALVRHGWSKMLINQQQMSGFTNAEETWMINEWLPRAVQEGGYRYGAVVVAHDVFARLAMTSVVMTSRKLGHQYRSFEHEPEAIAWLLKQG
ncbi:hypothetical protein GO988_16980 [Hymenobacter sp. HMF4947]|uniref:STAS/SEC14 domain-containing protein n=1 Tax=Hymenobacter ginkgonis TaxID=2682976 RepID=A0A7K1TI75_9BACT|nr:STAS/SEC14 domain-containing protein [Hymenobacter ginkgonis]MVN78026.1 hypothetical protein [Hymenobacter ginkgonis]